MTRIALAAYRFFRKHRAAFYVILVGSFALFAVLASRMYYEEDISKLLPSSSKNEGTRFAFDKLQVKDKIFLEFRPSQLPDNELSSDDLKYCASEFCDSLKAHDRNGDIEDILYTIEDTVIQRVAGAVLENAPVFVGEDFYGKVAKILNANSIDSLMRENLAILESNEGEAYYDIIRHDPLAFRNLAVEGSGTSGGSLSLGSSLFAPDDSLYIAYLSPAFKAMDSGAGTRLVDNLTKEINAYESAHPEVEILFCGNPVQSVFNAKRIKKDLALTVTFALLIICFIIGYSFRTKDTLFYLLLPLVYGVVFAIAMVYLIQGQMSFIALGIGAIVVGVALSYCMHVITHHKYLSDVEQVIKDQTKPVLLGCITTVGSLLGLIFTRSSLLRDFGLMASLVMIGTTLFAVFFLPQFFKASTSKAVKNCDVTSLKSVTCKNEKVFAAIEKTTTYPYYKRKWLIITVLCCFVLSLVLSKGKPRFDTDLVNIGYFEPKVMLADSLYSQRASGGLESEFYAVFSKNLDSALTYNVQMHGLCEELKSASVIESYTNTADILQPFSKQLEKITKWQNFFTEEKRALLKRLIASSAARYGFEEEMFEPFYATMEREFEPIDSYHEGVVPKGLMSNMIEYTDSTYLVFTSVKAVSNDNITQAGKSLTQNNLGEHTLVVNPFFYTSDMLELMNHDFNTVLLISSLFVLLILVIALRNVLYAIIAFLPMGMSWYIVLGVMAAAGVQFNLINIVISTFIFGMGVDYSIFVMDGLTRGGSGELLKYHRTAIFFSAVMLLLAVGSLMFAVHPAISSIGLSTLAGMISTIVITFTLQPFLFYLASRRKTVKK